ncbi:glutaredoxin 3 [Alteromonas sp. LMIT006]|jgi:glutaredoxin 3|uniref:glutaredoxin 3 n=1 Tax=Alteromonadaceae TaxID=72275 RepID=UPI0020CA75E8|nr:glutaredoxin 3 [Alteromonas sp. LMIT006]UTP72925.1 glutaredoxin 3 [Alteromonas sp. LMIT006]
MAKIELYTKDYCPYCKHALALFASKGVEVSNIEIQAEPGQRGVMIERAGGRTTVPQIFINDQHIGGCDDLFALDAQGKLDPLLA